MSAALRRALWSCVFVVGCAGADGSSDPTGSGASPVGALCERLQSMPCVSDGFELGNCVTVFGDAEQRATDVGCGAVLQDAHRCIVDNLECPAAAPTDPLTAGALYEGAAAHCAERSLASRACIKSACVPELTVCSPVSRAGPETCEIDYSNSCGVRRLIECQRAAGSADLEWFCVCDPATQNASGVELVASSCCELAEAVGEACGLRP